MPLPRSTAVRLLGVLLTAVLTLAGLAIGTSSAFAGVQPDPMAGAPAKGECHDVTIKGAYADSLTEAPVACSADHTLVTSAVVEVPAGVDMSDVDAVAASSGCNGRTQDLIGRDPLKRALTLYATFLFLPTAAQQDAGARWVSCHVAVWDAKGLNDLPTTLPRLARKPAARVARCLVGKALSSTTCAERHTHRAVHTFFVRASGTDKAISRKVARKASTCADKAGRSSLYSWHRHSDTKVIVTCFRRTTR